MVNKKDSRRDFLQAAGAVVLDVAARGKLSAAALKVAKQSGAGANFNVRDFGAKGDGHQVDTVAINQAIGAAAAAGGGTVLLPAGTYLSYSIRLMSHVRLQLASGTVLLAADPPGAGEQQGYDLAEDNKPWEEYQDFGHSHWHNSLIWGEGLENVSICGPGLIWGKGISRGEFQGPITTLPGVANKAIAFKNCHDVILRDFSILHGGHLGILTTGVDNLTIDNVKIDTNRAGIDMDCCRNVRVSNCSINAPWDDAICLKSSFALGHPRAAEMITISDCMVSGNFEEGTLLDGTFKRFAVDADIDRNGRIKFGTESNGGFKNITITNCIFDGCFGLAILSVDGAVIEDVTVSNITMRDMVASPIFIRLGSRMRGPTGTPVGAIRRINISNIVSSSPWSLICSIIAGVPGHRVEDVKISNVLIRHSGGGTRIDAARHLEEKETEYPEPNMFGNTPAHGLLIRHAAGIEISDYKVMAAVSDARPCFLLDDVERVDFSNVKTDTVPGTPAFVLKDVQDFSVTRCRAVPDTRITKAKHTEL
jgi:polygalacturonase